MFNGRHFGNSLDEKFQINGAKYSSKFVFVLELYLLIEKLQNGGQIKCFKTYPYIYFVLLITPMTSRILAKRFTNTLYRDLK